MSSAKQLISIKILSDIQCPWCIVGLVRLQEAMDINKDKYEFDIHFSPFLLNPYMGNQGLNFIDYFASKGVKGYNFQRLQSMFKALQQGGQQSKFKVNFPDPSPSMIMYNTVNSHRLAEWCLKKYGKQKQVQLYEHLLRRYFEDKERLDISKPEILAKYASQVGFDEKEVLEFISDDKAEPTQQTIKNLAEENAYQSGGQGVPLFIFNNKFAFSGAQEPDTFTEVFEELVKKK